MKSSCHFFFDHLGMPTKISDCGSPVSVLHGTNLYSLISSIYFHWSSLSISWQRTYSTGTIKVSLNHTLPISLHYSTLKSSNHVLSLHRLTSNSSSTTNFPWISLTTNCLTVLLGILLYSRSTDTHHRKHSLYCYVKRGTT
jgi:hypothetical protein